MKIMGEKDECEGERGNVREWGEKSWPEIWWEWLIEDVSESERHQKDI